MRAANLSKLATIPPVTRIDALTPEQEARFAEWRDRWIATGLRTGKADRERAEKAIATYYRAAKLDPPKRIVWVSSPLVGALAFPAALLLTETQKGDPAAVDSAVDSAEIGRAHV